MHNSTAGLHHRADARIDKGDFDGAVNDYDVVIGLDPTNWEAYTHRGEARRLQGDLVRSLADHDKAIEIDATLRWFRRVVPSFARLTSFYSLA
jgi:tetratricopeptide (TPR) repeat protein